jgi:hypothetical protein
MRLRCTYYEADHKKDETGGTCSTSGEDEQKGKVFQFGSVKGRDNFGVLGVTPEASMRGKY